MRIGRLAVEDFVRTWQTAPRLAVVAKTAGIRPAYASLAAGRLRRQGVRLRTFRAPSGLDVPALNAIAAEAR